MKLNIDRLINTFLSEAKDIIEKAEVAILNLEKGENSEYVNAIFRYIHTIKGNSGMLELTNITALAHSMENLLGMLRNNEIKLSKEMIDTLLEGVDFIKNMLDDIQNQASFHIEKVLSSINSMIQIESYEKKDIALKKEEMNNITLPDGLSPNDYKKLAEEKNSYLSLVSIDLNQQKIENLSELVSIIENISQNILVKGVDETKIEPVEKDNLATFPYIILLLTDIPVNEFLGKFNIIPTKIQVIHAPIQEKETGSNTVTRNKDKDLVLNTPNKGDQYIKVDIKLLDDLINLVGETIITRNQLLQRVSLLNDPESNESLSQMSQFITRLHEKIIHTRLQELDVVYQRIARIVRDTSKALGKKVELQLDGGEVELDKTVIDVISECIIHMVRNSIDHGIESPEERKASDKNPIGKIKLTASLQTGNIHITLEDDGKGLDSEKLKKAAIAKGFLTEQELSRMSQSEIYDLIFQPGFSTAAEVTETSGRGVGMDAVRTSLRKIGGNLHLCSKLKEGTSISIIIPQTVTVVSCLLITVSNIRYAVFQKNILELIKFEPLLYSVVNGHKMYRLREKLIPLIHLGNLFYPEEKNETDPAHIVIVKSESFHYGILFDQMLGTEEIVVKPLGEHFADLKIFSGATIMGNGETVLILDISGIAEFSKLASIENRIEKEILAKGISKKETGYILFEKSSQRFAISSSSVICIEKISFSKIETLFTTKTMQYKDDIISIVQLEDFYQIPKEDFEKDSYCIIINVNGKITGILIHDIINIVESITILKTNHLSGPGIIGQAIIDGHSTIVLDILELFKSEVPLLEEVTI